MRPASLVAVLFALIVTSRLAHASDETPDNAAQEPVDPHDVPPSYAPPPPPPAPAAGDTGFQLGARAGYGRTLDSKTGSALTSNTPSLLPIALDAGYKTSPHVYLGLNVQFALASRTDCGGASPCAAKDYRLSAVLQYHFKPKQAFDPWLGFGMGPEILHLGGFLGDTGGHVTRVGFNLIDLQFGTDFALGTASSHPALGPFVGLALGTTVSESGRVYGKARDNSSPTAYEWAMIGVRGTLGI
jgi:hypothetical protein